jgi:methylmalonyl-CoA/ethylmalonyl-CoA epimerase
MNQPGRFDHVAIAVTSIRDAARLFRDVFGAEFVSGGDDERIQIRTAQYLLPPGVKIELMEPMSEESYLHRYLEKRGPGFHHVTAFFDNIEDVISDLTANGIEVVDTDLSDSGWRETYIRPRHGFGTLLQLVDTDRDWSRPIPGITEEAVLEGRVVWEGSTPRLRDAKQ